MSHCSRTRDCIGVWERGARSDRVRLDASMDKRSSSTHLPSGATPGSRREVRRAICRRRPDGSILALVDGEGWGGAPDHGVFVRFTPSGEMLDVWPGVTALRPEPGTPIPRLSALGTAPTCVQGAPSLRAGADGVMNLFAAGEIGMVLTSVGIQRGEGRVVVRLRRDGAVNALPKLPFGTMLGGDATSRLWIVGGRGLLRVTRDGQIEQHLQPIASGGVVGKESVLAVEPRGAAILLGDDGAVRRFGPDGRVELVRE